MPVAKVVKKRIGYADNTKFIDEDIRTSYFIYLNLNKVKGAITLSPRSLIEQGGISNAGLLMDELIKTIQVID